MHLLTDDSTGLDEPAPGSRVLRISQQRKEEVKEVVVDADKACRDPQRALLEGDADGR